MGWDGPILTDSGGFQVFSLRDTIAAIDDDGVTFRSVYDGATARFTPELAAAIQAALGSDIAMCFDSAAARPSRAPRMRTRCGARRAWASAPERRDARPASSLRHRAGRRRPGAAPPSSAEEISELDFDGNAIGGLSIGESREQMFELTESPAQLLPAEKPRYFMGIGDPQGILASIERGVDMFDCVLPTRIGAHRHRRSPARDG